MIWLVKSRMTDTSNSFNIILLTALAPAQIWKHYLLN